jgi:hypothetical protein
MARATLFIILVALVNAVSAQGNSACTQWCAANFANPGGTCTSLAAKGGGPCYICGPLKTSQTEQLCKGVCSETKTDSNNCGGCGKVVSCKSTH